MRRRAEIVLKLGLLLLITYLVLSRGAYYRLYWWPAWIFGAGLFAAWLILRIHGALDPSPYRLPLPVILPLAVYLALALASLRVSINPEASEHAILRLGLIIMIYIMTLNLMCQPGTFRRAYLFLVALGMFEALYGLIQYQWGPVFFKEQGGFLFQLPGLIYRPVRWSVFGTFQDYNHFAGLMELTIFPALALMNLPQRKFDEPAINAVARWALKALAPAVMIAALALSLSRAGWISCLVGFFVFAVLFAPWGRMKLWWWLTLVVVLVAGAVATVSILDYSLIHSRAKTVEQIITQKDTRPMEGRRLSWRITLEMIEERPLLGSGIGTYRSAFPGHRGQRGQFGGVFAHNDLLHIASETGVISAIAFALWLGVSWIMGFINWRRTRSPYLAASLASLAAVFVHGLVTNHLLIPGFFALVAVHLALVSCVPEPAQWEDDR